MSEHMTYGHGPVGEDEILNTTENYPQVVEAAPAKPNRPHITDKNQDHTLDFAYDTGRNQIPFGD